MIIVCGKVNRASRIVGGQETEVHEYPWQVYLEVGRSMCGGSIISDKYILTAAHCTEGLVLFVLLYLILLVLLVLLHLISLSYIFFIRKLPLS